MDQATDPTQQTPPLAGRHRLSRPMRWVVGIAGLLVLALLAGAVTAVVAVRRPWPQTSGELTVPGLEGEVRVLRDDHGIPQIWADSMHDLMLAQGFVHAQERFYEMDVRRHATAGRLSEMFGESALETDLVVRTLNWRGVAGRELTLLRPATRSALDAYAEGVNAYLDSRSPSEISLEYAVLDIDGYDDSPEAWTAVDSLAWLKAMAWDLRGNLEEEIDRALSVAAVGERRAAALFPDYPFSSHPPVVQQGAVNGGVFDQEAEQPERGRARTAPSGDAASIVSALSTVRAAVGALPALLGSGDGLGSNAWVVSGERTASGTPILANDPHLGVSIPGVWMQIGLHCRTVSSQCPLDVAGFSFSGVPGIVIGHNRSIAWGFTNLGPDVTDLFVERITGEHWEYDGVRLPLTRRDEEIKVRGGDPVRFTVRSTSHGPLLSDLARLDAQREDVDLSDDGLVDKMAAAGGASAPETDPEQQQYGVSLAWTALTPAPTADALLALNAADDWRSFRSAVSSFAVPGQNIVYADVEGHIGYQATGMVPVRRSGNDGRLPAKGWLRSTDWTGRQVPFAELPSVLDPESGIIATANQAVIDPQRYQPFLTSDWDQGYRSTRINDLLAADDELSVDAMSSIQEDDWSAIAAALTPYLLDVDLPAGYYSDGQRLLRSWNYRQGADSAAAAYFNVVWREVLKRTFADELPEALAPDGGDRWFSVVRSLLSRSGDRWWDDVETDEVREQRDDILLAALKAARDELTVRQSPRAEEWTWGGLHRVELRNSSLGESGVDLIERLFNRGGWEVGGGTSIVNATAWDATKGYQVTNAPSMRMVIDLGDLDGARWINLTGVSGHAFSAHYADQTDLWAQGRTLPWRFEKDSVEKHAAAVLTLAPPDGTG